ncbi:MULTISPECIES: adenine deaminase C-terminal domain-containing protein [Pontibacillus]|uniref:adenine deaminase n=1 Tax=Pontibacillus chungwhensis TaxID=265426 RepID=A0ABY8V1I1_9BACI|nr:MULTISPECIES: adenine deaminase C-terminal domain-containing protein [Pontibacillus]MCD5325351.1 amidohydrolase family protein [Pontibacillus sp. HN14]WIF98469.1 adenine deaminase C-terminal domain-containing protein [Pontibacillus chungwhensis]
MNEHRYRWRNRQLREHVAVVDGAHAPSIVLTNATYLNVYLKQWIEANIWIYDDRIVYVGDALPDSNESTEVVDCTGQYLVPGYIEPHAHPFQLYNPHRLAQYALQTGTTTLINDNLVLLFLLHKKKAFSLLENLNDVPASMYWWSRFDSQSALQQEDHFLSDEDVQSWLEHDAVIQGGELTSWPSVLKDDDRVLHWMQETKRKRKPVEGHFPGASEKTLTKMKLLGTDSDHESMTGEEVWNRIRLGYMTALRYSSIRPDLPKLLQEMKDWNIKVYDRLMMTTDGATPSFYEQGIMDRCIEIALENGVPDYEAYSMASYNAAKHFGIDHRIGSIAPGCVAHINFLKDLEHPTPVSVLAKGKWVKQEGQAVDGMTTFDWDKHDLSPLQIDWELTERDLQFSIPLGLEMANEVILRPYAVQTELSGDSVGTDNEAFLMLIDRDGKWKVNSMIKGFTHSLGGLVSSYSNTGDFIFIGKNKSDMKMAFDRMKEIGGGIVLAHEGEIVYELPLPVAGMMSDKEMETIISEEQELKRILGKHGYPFQDPVYTLLFLSSTHLPFIRITPKGIMDVKKKEVLFPAIMR